jgi:hypothetical protein
MQPEAELKDPEQGKADDDRPAAGVSAFRWFILAATAFIILSGVVLAQLDVVQEMVRVGLLAETRQASLRVSDAYIPAGDTIQVHLENSGLEGARVDRAEITVERVWKLKMVRVGPDGLPPEGGWDVPISSARAPYMVATRVESEIPPEGSDSVRIVMRPEGSDYFVLMRIRLSGEGGAVTADAPRLVHFFPGQGTRLPTRIHSQQFDQLVAAGIDPDDPDIALTRARAEAWAQNWETVKEVQALGLRLSPAATEAIERLAWR